MKRSITAALTAIALCAAASRRISAQVPTQAAGLGAEPLLQQRPEVGALLRQRLLQSGLSIDQVRTRLRAAGLPANLLDQYLTADTTTVAAPSRDVLQVVSMLGLAQFSAADSQVIVGDSTRLIWVRDSLRLDSIAREDSLATLHPRVRVFGADVFREPTTQFVPLVTGPVDPTYRLGPGDVLVLVLTGNVQQAYQLEVTREGFVIIPQVGQLYVATLTLAALREALYDRLGRVYSGVRRDPTAPTKFDVTVARVRVNTVRVLGEVRRPGSYTVSALGTVLAALYRAGGPTERGNFRQVEIRRAGALVATLDLYDYLLSGDTRNDVRLESGDVVFLPVRGPRVTLAGSVVRPAIYELKPPEGLRELIRIAGGVLPQAYLGHATIDRILPPDQRPVRSGGYDRAVFQVNLRQVLDSSGPDYPLVAGDSVTVFSVTGPRRNVVHIAGNVWHPGVYVLEPAMRLGDLIGAAGGLKPDTYLGRVQILRLLPDSTRRLISTRLSGDTTPGAADPPGDPPLREFDEVTVYSKTEFRSERIIAVYGAVRRPAAYPFRDSMTVRDAILAAGGLTDEAWLMQAEISRVRDSVMADSLALVVRVPLDSSYMLDPTSQLARAVGASRAPEFSLRPYDNVFIRPQPGWETQRNVVITGQVRFPGRYTLLTRNERLFDLVQRAGGLTGQAYPNGIQFFRAEGNAGRIGVDLPRVLKNPKHKDNLALAAGDSIHIPPFVPTVRVEGAVNAPVSVTYVPGQGLDYYLNAAGGVARNGDRKRAFVRQPNGNVEGIRSRGLLLGSSKPKPQPGAVVVVPQRDILARAEYGAILLGVAQILTAATAIIAVLHR